MRKVSVYFITLVSLIFITSCSGLLTPDEISVAVSVDPVVCREALSSHTPSADSQYYLMVCVTGQSPVYKDYYGIEDLDVFTCGFERLQIGQTVQFEARLYEKNSTDASWVIKASDSKTVKIRGSKSVSLKLIKPSAPIVDGDDESLRITSPNGSNVRIDAELILGLETQIDGVEWTSSDPETATVSNGVVTGVKAGTVSITARANGYKPSVIQVTVSGYDGNINSFSEFQAAFTNGGYYLLESDIAIEDTVYLKTEGLSVTLIADKDVSIYRSSSFKTNALIHAGYNTSSKVKNTALTIKGIKGARVTIDGKKLDATTAVAAQGAKLTLSNVTFKDNYSGADVPGALLVNDIVQTDRGVAEVYIDNCSFENNSKTKANSSYAGGAVLLQDCLSKNNVIKNTSFTGNTSTSYGGALAADDSYINIENCTFNNNSGKGGFDLGVVKGSVAYLKSVECLSSTNSTSNVSMDGGSSGNSNAVVVLDTKCNLGYVSSYGGSRFSTVTNYLVYGNAQTPLDFVNNSSVGKLCTVIEDNYSLLGVMNDQNDAEEGLKSIIAHNSAKSLSNSSSTTELDDTTYYNYSFN